MVKLSFLSLSGQNPLVLTISMQPLHLLFVQSFLRYFKEKEKGGIKAQKHLAYNTIKAQSSHISATNSYDSAVLIFLQ